MTNFNFGVIFDMDGVLVDTNIFHKQAIQIFCEKYGKKFSDDELRHKVYGRTNRDWIPVVFGRALSEDEQTFYADEKESLFREIYKPHLAPVRGLVTFLEHLKENNIKIAVGTSAPRANVDFIVDATQTRHFFDVILDESFVTQGKPHPEIYLKCAEAIGFLPQHCLVIEDSLAGIAAGKASGAKVMGITTTHTAQEIAHVDLLIGNFENLSLQMLKDLF